MTERALADVTFTEEQWYEFLRLLGESRRERTVTPHDLPLMSKDEFRARRRALNPPMSWDDYPDSTPLLP